MPVRPTWTVISRTIVETRSGANLYAMAHLGNFDVKPCEDVVLPVAVDFDDGAVGLERVVAARAIDVGDGRVDPFPRDDDVAAVRGNSLLGEPFEALGVRLVERRPFDESW